MNDQEKYKIAFRLTTGASSGLQFLEDHLSNNQKTDIAFIRSIYILLSYYVELLLKSRIVMVGIFSDESEIKKCLTFLSHNLSEMGNQLGNAELLKAGIKKITKNNTQYIIKTVSNGDIFVEDFVDIRYDYIFGRSRVVSRNEHEKIMKYINNLFEILVYVKTLNAEQIKIKK